MSPELNIQHVLGILVRLSDPSGGFPLSVRERASALSDALRRHAGGAGRNRPVHRPEPSPSADVQKMAARLADLLIAPSPAAPAPRGGGGLRSPRP